MTLKLTELKYFQRRLFNVYLPHRYTLRYFKLEVARVVLESTRSLVIAPIYVYEYDNIISDGESGFSFFKRLEKSRLRGNFSEKIYITEFRKELVNLVQDRIEEWIDFLKYSFSQRNLKESIILTVSGYQASRRVKIQRTAESSSIAFKKRDGKTAITNAI